MYDRNNEYWLKQGEVEKIQPKDLEQEINTIPRDSVGKWPYVKVLEWKLWFTWTTFNPMPMSKMLHHFK